MKINVAEKIGCPLKELFDGELFVFNTSPTKVFIMVDNENRQAVDLETSRKDNYASDEQVYRVKLKEVSIEYVMG